MLRERNYKNIWRYFVGAGAGTPQRLTTYTGRKDGKEGERASRKDKHWQMNYRSIVGRPKTGVSPSRYARM